MDTRFDLVRRAQAGDETALRSLIQHHQAMIYHLALTLLDDPGEAAQAVKETFHAAFGQLEEYRGSAAFSTWLYPFVVDVCRKRMRQRHFMAQIAAARRKLLQVAEPEQARTGPGERLIKAVQRLDVGLRLPFVLRYDQELTLHELALMLGEGEIQVQKQLKTARRQVRAAAGAIPWQLADGASGSQSGLSHRAALEYMEDAADHLITDANGEKLRLHLASCAACLEASRQLDRFAGDMHAAFEKRWAVQALPDEDFAGAVNDLGRTRRARRRLGNLVGAGVITVVIVAMIAFLPGLTPPEAMPQPMTATPTLAARQRQRTVVRPTRAPLKPDPNLLNSIYPGHLAFITSGDQGSHVFTLQSNGSDVQQLTYGVSIDSNPVWSPDGKRLAYLAIPKLWGVNEVNVIDADGKNMHTVSQPDFPQFSAPSMSSPYEQDIHYPLYGPPHWSPDGKWIASTVWVGAIKSYLALLSPDGGPARYLHADDVDRMLIAWSPDSTSLAAFSEGSGGLWVWQIDQPEVGGENPRRIAADTLWDIGLGLAWSPDGGRIAVIVGVVKDATIDVSLMIYNTNSGIDRAMPISGDLAMGLPLRNAGLTWSPDGRYLAFIPVFSALDHTNNEIYLIQINRTREQILVQSEEPISSYAWSPDGKWLAYSAGVEVWAASLDAFERNRDDQVQIAPSGGFNLSWQPVSQAGP